MAASNRCQAKGHVGEKQELAKQAAKPKITHKLKKNKTQKANETRKQQRSFRG